MNDIDKINSSVIILDIRNFTPLMKKYSMNPDFLNMIKNIYEYGLQVTSAFCKADDFYINSKGDGFLCIIFGENHYVKAYLIGLLLLKHARKYFNDFFLDKKDSGLYPSEGRDFFGIGLESGNVEKIETQVINGKKAETYLGNVINIAARIEALSKEHGRTTMLFGPIINDLLAKNLFGFPYNELISKAKDFSPAELLNIEEQMIDINYKLLSSYIFEHMLKGVDKPLPIFRISPTQFKNMNTNEWEFLTKIPSDIKTVFESFF